MSKKFKLPTKSDLKSRSSTISNAFAISITPYIVPGESDTEGYYDSLGIKEGQCAYCLGDGNGRDHLKPLVKNGMPTGYITDIHNIVPCCQRCNSAKGAKSFREWYLSPENVSRLKRFGLDDATIENRYSIICKFEESIPAPIDYKAIVGEEMWNEYQDRRMALLKSLADNQAFCDLIRKKVLNEIRNKNDE